MMWPLSNITSAQNTTTISTNRSSQYQVTSNPIFCQVVSCVNRYDIRSQSPTFTKRNIECFSDQSTSYDEVELIYSYKVPKTYTKKLKSTNESSSPTKRSKGCIKESSSRSTETTSSPKKSKKKKKTVTFDLIEVREHPRILGDNPSAKKGPPLSIGWYEPDCRMFRYSVDEYERRRDPYRSKSVEIISPTERQRMLLQDVGVTPSEIFAARKEVSKIRKSRRDHNILVNYDETVVVLEQCISTVQRLLSATGSSPEHELQALMDQAERSKLQQQQFKQRIQEKQQYDTHMSSSRLNLHNHHHAQ